MTRPQRLVLGVFLVLALAGIAGQFWPLSAPEPAAPGSSTGETTIAHLFAEQRSGELVEVEGVVERILPDDRVGNPHQRFVVRLANGMTLLVAHNIALAPRVDVEPGDRVRLRGEYAWNPQGGVLHWTHPDPNGTHPPGWIRVRRGVD